MQLQAGFLFPHFLLNLIMLIIRFATQTCSGVNEYLRMCVAYAMYLYPCFAQRERLQFHCDYKEDNVLMEGKSMHEIKN